MLRITDAGTVRHNLIGLHHAVQKPRRSDAEAAINHLSDYIEAVAPGDRVTAAQLRQMRDTLAVVVRTAY